MLLPVRLNQLLQSDAWNGQSAWRSRNRGPAGYLALTILLALVYMFLAKLGLTFTSPNTDTAFFWPPSGFGTAFLFVCGLKYLPAVTLGSAGANILFSSFSTSSVVLIISVDTLEAFTAVSLLRILRFHSTMDRLRDIAVFFISTIVIAATLAAFLGTSVFVFDGQLAWTAFWPNAAIYWVSNAMANLCIAPAFLTWLSRRAVLFQMRETKVRLVELAVLAVMTIALGLWTWSTVTGYHNIVSIEYILFPLLIWSGLRFGPRISSLVVLVVSLAAIVVISATSGGSVDEVNALLLSVQMFLAAYAITGLVIAATAEEQAATRRQLQKARDSLEVQVADRTEDLQNANAFLEATLDNVSAAIIAVDQSGKLTHSNREARQMFEGLEDVENFGGWAERFKLLRSDGSPLPEDEVPLKRSLRGETLRNTEIAFRGSDATLRQLLVSGQPIKQERDDSAGGVIVAHDITELKEAQDLQRLFSQATVISNEAPDTEQAVLSILELVCSHTGWAAGHALAVEDTKLGAIAVSTGWWYASNSDFQPDMQVLSTLKFSAGEDLPGRVLSSAQAEWMEVAGESTVRRISKMGVPPVTTALAFPVTANSHLVAIIEFLALKRVAPNSRLLETMQFVADQLGRVYERELATQKLMRMTLRDPLTGLPNRLAFHEVITQALAHARRRHSYSFAILFLDLDRFKVINDSLGHAAGDKVLLETASRIQACLREGDSMARLGGDEFTVFLDDLGQRSDSANAAKVARRINDAIEKPIRIGDEEVQVSSSIGIVLSNPSYTEPDELMRDADAAMYRAKAEGRSQSVLFSPQMHFTAMHQLRMESDLRQALKKQEFKLFFQPVVELQTAELKGFEALLRWDHPEKGLISPGDFLPVCEEAGLIVPLGEWTIMEACRWVSKVNKIMPEAAEPLSVSVNISSVHFTKGVVVGQVESAISRGLIKPGQLKLEIVESALVKNPEEAVYVIEALRALNVEVLIDDFGTGYSSLSYLATLPIDALKIDRSFVNDITRNENSAEVVRCIISMAEALSLSVIGEGIETERQAQALLKFGCKLGQGYYYHRPLPESMATALCVAHANSLNELP